ncbi:MAG: DnaD domain protein [Bacilli bacterium]|nr:DnaD domain protein [Bacilli bacterium]
MELTLLPADIYTVINKTVLTEVDRNNLISLYEPIIGVVATSLYLTLWRDLGTSEILSPDYNHHHLMKVLKLDLTEIKLAIDSLEAVGLIRTYVKEDEINKYVYELYSPLSSYEFFHHPIFNVVLYNNVGKEEYDRLKAIYDKVNIDLKDYHEVTKLMDMTFKTSSHLDTINPLNHNELSVTLSDQVDFDLIISSIPKGVLSDKAFSKKTKELINALAFTYNINTLKMVELIRSSINELGQIDKETLRKSARKYYQYNNDGNLPTLVYRLQPDYLKSPVGDNTNRGKIIKVFENTTPYDFLASKSKGANPTNHDLKIVEYLLVDVGLKPAVVNVLIDYVLKVNNNKFNQAFVETIAAQWARSGVKTASDAMELAEKHHKKYNKNIKEEKKVKDKPVWFNETIKREEISEAEKSELQELMSKFR